ncbi:MAG TPA: phosphate ABC transporter permease subunit PstC [Acidimicrobiales bacterium]|jgi:phosphate transport system permease protein|nr:phosphate ABC transporter permease subunit PstC [Acidimicrobiales bacterium]
MTDTTVTAQTPPSGPVRTRRTIVDKPSRSDRLFDLTTLGAGLLVLVLLTLVGVFLLYQGRHAWAYAGWHFFTTTEWSTNTKHVVIGVAGLLFGTVIVALIAECIAVPMGVFAALFISEYAPLRLRKILQGLIDVLAAIPSLLFGLWAFLTLQYQIEPLSRWLTTYFGWIPIFATTKGASLLSSMFIAGIVVSLMCVPIVASICRAVFAQTPPGEKEAALALGATRWGMIRTVVLPYGKGGIIGGSMLGLGRALGETIAVTLILPQVPHISLHFLEQGGGTIAGFIAQRAGSDPFTVSGLMAAGLVLFCLTLVTNLIASTIVSRSRSGAAVDL